MPCQGNSWEYYLETTYPGTIISWHTPLLAPQASILLPNKQKGVPPASEGVLPHHGGDGIQWDGWACFPGRCQAAERDQASQQGSARAGQDLLRQCGQILPSAHKNPPPLSPPIPVLSATRVLGWRGMLETSEGSSEEVAWFTTTAPNSPNGSNREHGGNRAVKINSSTLRKSWTF